METVAQTNSASIMVGGRRMEPLQGVIMETLRRDILVLLALLMVGAGCRHRHRTPTVYRPVVIQLQRPATPAAVTWGPAAEGLQCRLRPVRRACPAGESPAFRVDLRNSGGRVFAFVRGDQAPLHQYCIDGRWLRWPERPPTDGKVQPLGPGVEVSDMPVVFPADARPLLTSGRHLIQIAFSFEGIDVVSEPVDIEIIGP